MIKYEGLSEQGHKEAIVLIEKFKRDINNIAEQAIGNLYSEIMPYIESDSWVNYREKLRLELQKKYINVETCTSEEAWAKFVREAIFTQYRTELEFGIIADMQKRINFLEKMLSETRFNL